MVLPEMATESPNQSWTMPPRPFSSPLWRQPVAVLVNTYARPMPEEAAATAGAPTTIVLPEAATALPNQPPAPAPGAASSANCLPGGADN